MKSLNSLKQSLTTLDFSKISKIKGGTYTITDSSVSNTAGLAGEPWDNRKKRPGSTTTK